MRRWLRRREQLSTPPPASSAPYLFTASNGQVWSFAVNSSTGALGSGASVAVSGTS